MAADELAVDLQVVVRRAADDEAAGRQLALRDRLAVEADQDAAERDAPLAVLGIASVRVRRACCGERQRLQLHRALGVFDPLQLFDRGFHVARR